MVGRTVTEYVWDGVGLATEVAFGAADGTQPRWRKTYVPGTSGLDDAVQVVVEVESTFPGNPYAGRTELYTFLRDEMGSVVGLVADGEPVPGAGKPPMPVRYLYTPYGDSHAETGPELRRARFDASVTTAGSVSQSVLDEHRAAPGSMVLDWSLGIDEAGLGAGLAVEKLDSVQGAWKALSPAEVAVVAETAEGDTGRVVAIALRGWEASTSYRIRIKPELKDALGRAFGQTETLEWRIPEPPAEPSEPVASASFDKKYPLRFESFDSARNVLAGRFPGGQTSLFQGLWTDPVTGIAYARARWYDVKNGSWLSEDPEGAGDSTNLYAFVGLKPTMGTDPKGLATFEHATTPETAETILRSGGFDATKGESGYTWFEPQGQEATGGPSMSGKTAVFRVEYSGAPEGTVPYSMVHNWYKEAESALKEEGLTGGELRRAADAVRWRRVFEFLKSEGKASYRIEIGKGRFFLALNQAGLRGARITALSGADAGRIISRLALAGKTEGTMAAAEAFGLSSKAALRFGRAATVIRWVGRPAIFVAAGLDLGEIHRARYQARTVTSVAAGWAGMWLGAKAGAWVCAEGGAAIALVAGQLGPQVAAPEEVVTVPVAGAVGGIVCGVGGGIGGYFLGRKVVETTYDWAFTPGVNVNER